MTVSVKCSFFRKYLVLISFISKSEGMCQLYYITSIFIILFRLNVCVKFTCFITSMFILSFGVKMKVCANFTPFYLGHLVLNILSIVQSEGHDYSTSQYFINQSKDQAKVCANFTIFRGRDCSTSIYVLSFTVKNEGMYQFYTISRTFCTYYYPYYYSEGRALSTSISILLFRVKAISYLNIDIIIEIKHSNVSIKIDLYLGHLATMFLVGVKDIKYLIMHFIESKLRLKVCAEFILLLTYLVPQDPNYYSVGESISKLFYILNIGTPLFIFLFKVKYTKQLCLENLFFSIIEIQYHTLTVSYTKVCGCNFHFSIIQYHTRKYHTRKVCKENFYFSIMNVRSEGLSYLVPFLLEVKKCGVCFITDLIEVKVCQNHHIFTRSEAFYKGMSKSTFYLLKMKIELDVNVRYVYIFQITIYLLEVKYFTKYKLDDKVSKVCLQYHYFTKYKLDDKVSKYSTRYKLYDKVRYKLDDKFSTRYKLDDKYFTRYKLDDKERYKLDAEVSKVSDIYQIRGYFQEVYDKPTWGFFKQTYTKAAHIIIPK
ncbi:hypothetical protein LOTGIDRAFT_172801 [Lottia gigantea]|uniref:Uncharacterized protein n=1 Tax=Lottia gigantea TaxID=225164 RepID=V4AUT1_LOTGI|nr:hypothetical protein LOTGIDRAFT_172801 [Lottia gigantea]ESP01068.1 hypothetical protein LOTGIDRAFT_172801 [Lottia gigantea]